MGSSRRLGELLQGPRTQRGDRHSHSESPVAQPGDDVIVSKSVDRVHEVRLPPKWVATTSADTDLHCEFDRAHGDRATGALQMARQRSSEEYSSWANQRRVDDLEVGVIEREGALGRDRQSPEPQARIGIRLALGSPGRTTAGLR